MAEFGQLLKVSQATVSRYESGELEPGFRVLILLLELSEGAERNAIRETLQKYLDAAESHPLGKDEEGAFKGAWNSLWECDPQSLLLRATGPLGRDEVGMKRFADVAARIIQTGRDVDASLVRILELWESYSPHSYSWDIFRQVEGLLHFLLVVKGPEANKGKRNDRTPEDPSTRGSDSRKRSPRKR